MILNTSLHWERAFLPMHFDLWVKPEFWSTVHERFVIYRNLKIWNKYHMFIILLTSFALLLNSNKKVTGSGLKEIDT